MKRFLPFAFLTCLLACSAEQNTRVAREITREGLDHADVECAAVIAAGADPNIVEDICRMVKAGSPLIKEILRLRRRVPVDGGILDAGDAG
jgi:hypothetical protein